MSNMTLVQLYHGEAMTTSETIASGVDLPHKTVIQLIRKYENELQEFGPLAFEMRKGGKLPQGGCAKSTEFAWLNEGQAIFILTLMRNSEIVVTFKVSLVKAFLELRDKSDLKSDFTNQPLPEYSNPLSLSHRADIAVAADRTFRAMMRSGRTVGLPLPQALRRANEITLQKTGVDMLRELGAEDAILPRAPVFDDAYGVSRFFTAWMDGALPVPFTVCRSTHFYRAYELWAGENGIEPTPVNVFFAKAYAHRDRVKKGIVHGKKGVRAVIPVGAKVSITSGEWSRHAEKEMERFASALKKWDKPD